MFLRKGVLKVCGKFTEEHPCCFTTLLKSHFGIGVLLWICCIFSGQLFIEFRLSGGELFDKICELEYLTEVDACIYMKQVLEAIDHLHDNNIVHLDIKVNTGINNQGEFLLKKALAAFL